MCTESHRAMARTEFARVLSVQNNHQHGPLPKFSIAGDAGHCPRLLRPTLKFLMPVVPSSPENRRHAGLGTIVQELFRIPVLALGV